MCGRRVMQAPGTCFVSRLLLLWMRNHAGGKNGRTQKQTWRAEAYSTGKSSCSSVAPICANRSKIWDSTSVHLSMVALSRSTCSFHFHTSNPRRYPMIVTTETALPADLLIICSTEAH